MIIEEPEVEAEKCSEKEDTNSSEGSTGVCVRVYVCQALDSLIVINAYNP